MKVKAKENLKGHQFSHQDIKQCGEQKILDLLAGKVIDVPDPKTSVGVPLTFLKKVVKIEKGK